MEQFWSTVMEGTITTIAQANVTLTERRERTSLRILLDTVTELTQQWLKITVCVAKLDKLKFHEFRKILSRIFREKQIRYEGYRKMLGDQWYSVAGNKIIQSN